MCVILFVCLFFVVVFFCLFVLEKISHNLFFLFVEKLTSMKSKFTNKFKLDVKKAGELKGGCQCKVQDHDNSKDTLAAIPDVDGGKDHDLSKDTVANPLVAISDVDGGKDHDLSKTLWQIP
jgi:hypothetical protein